jgi:hypothetical protein
MCRPPEIEDDRESEFMHDTSRGTEWEAQPLKNEVSTGYLQANAFSPSVKSRMMD